MTLASAVQRLGQRRVAPHSRSKQVEVQKGRKRRVAADRPRMDGPAMHQQHKRVGVVKTTALMGLTCEAGKVGPAREVEKRQRAKRRSGFETAERWMADGKLESISNSLLTLAEPEDAVGLCYRKDSSSPVVEVRKVERGEQQLAASNRQPKPVDSC